MAHARDPHDPHDPYSPYGPEPLRLGRVILISTGCGVAAGLVVSLLKALFL